MIEIKSGIEPFPGYRLVQFLGRGGWGEVWRADGPGKKRVALKFLGGAGSTVSSMEIRALNGIKALAHPNLLRTEHIWSCENYLVICMELADGSLHDLLDVYYTELGSPMQPEHLCFFMQQAAAGIDFLNARQHMLNEQRVGFRHCDIKPSNLLIVGNVVKVADFSLVFPTSSPIGSHPRVGTLQFAAPEIYQGLVSEWSDQFSLAVTYCQLRLGRLPFPPSPPRFISDYKRPTPDLTGLPYAERTVLLRALDSIPQGRWKSCTEFVRQLGLAIGKVAKECACPT